MEIQEGPREPSANGWILCRYGTEAPRQGAQPGSSKLGGVFKPPLLKKTKQVLSPSFFHLRHFSSFPRPRFLVHSFSHNPLCTGSSEWLPCGSLQRGSGALPCRGAAVAGLLTFTPGTGSVCCVCSQEHTDYQKLGFFETSSFTHTL